MKNRKMAQMDIIVLYKEMGDMIFYRIPTTQLVALKKERPRIASQKPNVVPI